MSFTDDIKSNIAIISSIVTGIGFIASEILPFLPCKSNGIVHSVFTCLSKFKKTDDPDINENQKKMLDDFAKNGGDIEEILKISRSLDEKLRRENEAVVEIKARLDEILLDRLL